MPSFAPQEAATTEVMLTLEEKRRLEDEEAERMMAGYADEEVSSEANVEISAEIKKFEALVEAFEAQFSIEVLMAISTEEEAKDHLVRGSAMEAMIAINSQFNVLRDSSSIPSEDLARVSAERKRLTRIVGYKNNGKLDHDR